MDTEKPSPQRFFGLDIHKRYLVAVAVDPAGNRVYGPRRVAWSDLERWRDKTLAPHDALVIEMTTNTWQVYDELSPYVLSVTVVHPPHVRLVTEPKVYFFIVLVEPLHSNQLPTYAVTVPLTVPFTRVPSPS